MARIRISAPKTASPGEVIQIKTMIQHPMESGFRRDMRGERIPRDILEHFHCEYDGETVFKAEFFPAVAANPFLTFYTRATQSGQLTFTWTDQNGAVETATHDLTVA